MEEQVSDLNGKLEKIQRNIENLRKQFNIEEDVKSKEIKKKIENLSSDKESLLKLNDLLKQTFSTRNFISYC